jgi:serine/threonine protein kinase/tetratricopeptide (TPR) repeat protein
VKLVSSVCGKCGAKILADAPRGSCPACLVETALNLLLQEPVAGVGDPGLNAGVPVPDTNKAARSARMVIDFGDYELLEEIGRGGQGVVYRARQKSLNRTVALKVIGLGQWATQAHLKRFRREAESAANLDHPCIVPIYDVGEREGSCYFSMKFIDGGQLDEVTKRSPISIRDAAELIAKLARTVHYAHEHGILHRDIKPGNILLDAKGEPHLTDFGLARLLETKSTVTNTMDVLGTPSYMAPEQASGHNTQLTSATDVYGLGAVFYQLLTGHPPFAGGTTYETVRLVLETEPRQPRLSNPKIGRELSTICLKCLEKDPKRRYSSALALAEDLEHWLKHEPIRARRSGFFTHARKWVRRNPTIAVMATLLLVLSGAVSTAVWKSKMNRPPMPTGIAVLPFENLSGDKENAFFADGVQDDILTKLAKIADLKVISRTSVMPYRGARNTRQIGDALRVSHVLEGSVQRAGSKVRVNAQLIDTRTDAHVWAEEYDRDLSDIFAIQSEIAQKIADRLQAKVSAAEKAAIEKRPTKDLAAYDLYVRAMSLLDWAPRATMGRSGYHPPNMERDLFEGVELLNQAIARDPGFVLAYCRLAYAHDSIYWVRLDHTPNRLSLAKAAIDSAFRVQPESADAHLALARHLYWGYFDYDHARDELAMAARTLPNDVRVFHWSATVDRRQGRWHDALRNFERTRELDPRNGSELDPISRTYSFLRDYKHARDSADQLLEFEPSDISAQLLRAWIDVHERGDTQPLHVVVGNILANDPAAAKNLSGTPYALAMYERDFLAADRAAAMLTETENGFTIRVGGMVWINRACAQGLIARAKGDTAAAHAAFIAARVQQEETVRMQPKDVGAVCALGLIDAGLGRKEEALREGRQTVELMPVAQNALDGPEILYFFAVICAWTGERDLAIKQLETLAKIPVGASYGELRLDPAWDSLRGDERFEKIVASLAPKEN